MFDRLESDVRSYCRTYPAVFDRAVGPYLYDRSGKRYLDFLCGAGALGYGHNDRNIKVAVLDYLSTDRIISSLDLHTAAKIDFLKTLERVILRPRGLEYRVQCCGPTGADAVEAAMKLARKVTGRTTIAAFTNAYHGVSLGALAVSASQLKRGAAGVSLEHHIARLPFEGFHGSDVDTIALIEDMFGPGGGLSPPAAFVVETIQAEGGVNVGSTQWLRRLADLATGLGALLIVDDVQVGCGRTGSFFSFEEAGIVPDIVCLSKSIGGMGMPMACNLIRPAVDLWIPGEHVGTFRGNNLAFVAATAALAYWETAALAEQIAIRARDLRGRLAAIARRHDGIKVRGRGLIAGVELPDADVTSAAVAAAFARGLIVEAVGPRRNVLKLLPPLNIGEGELEEGTCILADAIDDVLPPPS